MALYVFILSGLGTAVAFMAVLALRFRRLAVRLKLLPWQSGFIFRLDQNIPPYIVSDEQCLAQVLANLLSNAVKFTPDEGTITLSVKALSTDGDLINLRFDVIDSGIGISPGEAGRLFTLFEQADGSISRRFGGTGLGLAVSRSIINLMGGKILVDSELDKGSDFATDVAIDYAKNGIEALNLFKENPSKYGAILMDVHMPEMDGFEATRYIREFEAALNTGSGQAPRVPIIAMTANVCAEDIDLCFAAGMNGHPGKPIDSLPHCGIIC